MGKLTRNPSRTKNRNLSGEEATPRVVPPGLTVMRKYAAMQAPIASHTTNPIQILWCKVLYSGVISPILTVYLLLYSLRGNEVHYIAKDICDDCNYDQCHNDLGETPALLLFSLFFWLSLFCHCATSLLLARLARYDLC